MTGPTDPFDGMERLFDQLTEFGSAGGGDVPVDVVDEGATEASYENGVLTVRLGKQAAGGEGTDIPVN